MTYTWRIWDKKSPINGCPADKAIESLGLTSDQQLCIISSSDGVDNMVQKFPSTASSDDIKTWAENTIKQMETPQTPVPTTEEKLESLNTNTELNMELITNMLQNYEKRIKALESKGA